MHAYITYMIYTDMTHQDRMVSWKLCEEGKKKEDGFVMKMAGKRKRELGGYNKITDAR